MKESALLRIVRIICLLVCVAVLYSTVTAEVAKDVLPPSEVERAFNALPDSPTDGQCEEFYTLLKRYAQVTAPADEKQASYGYGYSNIFGGSLLGNEFIYREIFNQRRIEKAAKDSNLLLPARKNLFLPFALARVVLECDPSVEYAPRDNMDQRRHLSISLFINAVNNFKRKPLLYLKSIQELVPYHEKYARQYLAETKILDWLHKNARPLYDALNITGDKANQLEVWQKLYFDNTNNIFMNIALMSWFFVNITPEDVTDLDEKALPPSFNQPLKAFVDNYGKKEVFYEILEQFSNTGVLSSYNRSAYFLVSYLLYTRMDDNEIWENMSSMNTDLTNMLCNGLYSPVREHLLLPEAMQASRVVMNKVLDYLYKPKQLPVSHKLRLVEEGESGPAWFCGGVEYDPNMVPKIERDFVHPQYFYIRGDFKGSRLETKTISLETLLFDLDHYEWSQKYFEENEPPRCIGTRTVGSAFKAMPVFPEALGEMIADGWAERFLNGISNLDKMGGNLLFKQYFRPAVYYKYERTKWRIYVLSDYYSVTSLCWHDNAACVVEITPLGDEPASEVKAGLIYYRLNAWYCRAGIPNGRDMLWSAKEFREAEANKPIFDRAEAINLENTDTTGGKLREAWQKLYDKYHLEELR